MHDLLTQPVCLQRTNRVSQRGGRQAHAAQEHPERLETYQETHCSGGGHTGPLKEDTLEEGQGVHTCEAVPARREACLSIMAKTAVARVSVQEAKACSFFLTEQPCEAKHSSDELQGYLTRGLPMLLCCLGLHITEPKWCRALVLL
jgi:hypothetical protein